MEHAVGSSGLASAASRKGVQLALLGMIAAIGLAAAPSAALSIKGNALQPALVVAPPDPCPETPQIRFSATPSTVALGQGVVLSWNVQVQSGCRYLLHVDGKSVPLQGSMSVVPLFERSYGLQLVGTTQASLHTAYVPVSVELPADPAYPGHKLVRLTAPTYGLFAQALRTRNTTLLIDAGVELDLSNYDEIPIEAGVRMIGNRSVVPGKPFLPGARLYTRTRPRHLFRIRGDGVRISGLRIQGRLSIDPPEIPSSDSDASTAILIPLEPIISSGQIEIDHNEIFGWSACGISISNDKPQPVVSAKMDFAIPLLSYGSERERVWIHDNYIHHILHEGKLGYGVVVGGRGSHALIERNVFDWNRHAIAGDGEDFSGYRAYGNLVLENGGHHMWVAFPGFWAHTHQFDMHGLDSYCLGFLDFDGFKDRACGSAGYAIDIRHNSFLYTAAAAIKIRGAPMIGAVVDANVFAHGSEGDAVQWTEDRVAVGRGNRYGVTMTAADACDFDGDGLRDRFLSTGQTWWFSSDSGRGPWIYLNQSTEMLPTASLGDRDGDAICDVSVGSAIYRGGTTLIRVLIQPKPTSYNWNAVPKTLLSR